MGTQPVQMLQWVVDQVADVLEAIQRQEKRRGRRGVVDVLHPLDQGQQAIVTEQDTEVRDGVGQVADALCR